MKYSVLLALFMFVAVSYAALPYAQTTCTVTMNDYNGKDCNGDALPPGPTDAGNKKRQEVVFRSCNVDADDGQGFAFIQVTFPGSNGTISVCNTKNCGYGAGISEVKSWLVAHKQGEDYTCYYNTNDKTKTYFAGNGPCNYAGTFTYAANGQSSCDCNMAGTGDDCGQPYVPEDRTSNANTVIVSCIAAFVGLLAVALLNDDQK